MSKNAGLGYDLIQMDDKPAESCAICPTAFLLSHRIDSCSTDTFSRMYLTLFQIGRIHCPLPAGKSLDMLC